MPITINGTGSITGVTAGGLPSGSVTTANIADANITAAKLDGAQSGSAPIYGARAWVNFNGTGTVAIRAALNVTSITGNAVGDYTVNFTTALADANYSVCYGGGDSGSNMGRSVTSSTATAHRLTTRNTNNAGLVDDSQVFVAVFR